MLRILALTWTTFDDEQELMINSRSDLICPAIDGITNIFLQRGHQVVYVNLFYKHTHCLSHISGLPYHRWEDIKNRKFDIVWHAIKDPTPPNAVIEVRKIMSQLPKDIPIWNNVEHLQTHTKRKYVSKLREKNVGAIILEDELKPFWNEKGQLDFQNKCFPPSQGCYVTKDYNAIRLNNVNSRRIHPLFSPEGGLTLKYHNTANNKLISPDGYRVFFRVPYAAGKCMEGFKYYCPPEILCPKSGAAVKKEPFYIPDMSGGTIGAGLKEIGVDLAHLEGVQAGFTVEIFDVNPFPSSAGASLTPISEQIVKRLEQVYDI
jgi:hypothetical protein